MPTVILNFVDAEPDLEPIVHLQRTQTTGNVWSKRGIYAAPAIPTELGFGEDYFRAVRALAR